VNTIQPITRKFLVDVGRASQAKRSDAMTLIIARLIVAGFYAEATEDEIEEFDAILEAMERG